jgi:hypothetical protein
VAAEAQRKSEKYQKIARKLKVTLRSRVTGVHLLSTFMRIEAYRMFEYDAEKRMYHASTRTIRGFLFATGPSEEQMWSLLLGPSSPCAITSNGRFIPIFRCATTKFHWMPESWVLNSAAATSE